LGLRLKESQLQQVDLLKKKWGMTRTEVIKALIQGNLDDKNRQTDSLKEEFQNLQQQVRELYEINRFTASLLIALVRKTSKTDPSEAEKMIQVAKQDARKITITQKEE
jgi:hypothetical protein